MKLEIMYSTIHGTHNTKQDDSTTKYFAQNNFMGRCELDTLNRYLRLCYAGTDGFKANTKIRIYKISN